MKKIKLEPTFVNKRYVMVLDFIKSNPQFDVKEISNYCNVHENTIYNSLKSMALSGWINLDLSRDGNGRFDTSTKIINIEYELSDHDLLCSKCGAGFFKKLKKAKHPDICNDCTTELFMSPKMITCYLCEKDLEARKARKISKSDKFCHDYCYSDYMLKKKELKKFLKICKNCNLRNKQKNNNLCLECIEKKFLENSKTCNHCKSRHVTENCMNEYCCYARIINDLRDVAGLPKHAVDILGSECKVCGYSNCIEYHHIIYKENGGGNNIYNLIPLCPNHHREVHIRGLDISIQVSELKIFINNFLENIKNV